MNQEEPLRQSYYVGVKAIISKQGKVLIIKEKNKWELPGGRIDQNQTIQDSLARELEEEIGAKGLKIKRIVYATQGDFTVENEHKFFLVFFEVETKLPDVIRLSHEHTASDWVDPDTVGDFELFNSDKAALLHYFHQTGKNWAEI